MQVSKKGIIIVATVLMVLFAYCGNAYVVEAQPIEAPEQITLVLASSSTENITDIVMDFMPLIITFAMLGMILGLLKKFGKI
ncbi:MAG: hypothetical protein DRN49_01660 [Thaumarchaeota archaeon]|nr:MAG: hypothetical protein DRN49_01660 [Nitrososphaerota archaeon]